MKLATLKAGQFVETGGYYTKGDDGQAKYLIVAAQAADGYRDHTLANGTVAVLQISGVANVNQFGADVNSADTSASIQAALDSGYSVAISKAYRARGLTLTKNNISVYFFGETAEIKNPSGVTGITILTVSGEGVTIYNGVIDGDGSNDPGGLAAVSLSGLVLNGRNNKAVRCVSRFIGKLLTAGDQGGTNQVGVGFGGASDDPEKPNVFEDCIGYSNGNYGFNPRANVSIIRGGSYGNGTNGVGNRLCSNFHVDGHNIGVQYQGNPDTDSVGMTLDTESSGHADYQKLSKNCSFKNMIIEDNESGSISCSFYSDTFFENVYAKGDVLIQSSTALVAPDIGTTGIVTVAGLTTDKSFSALNHQKLRLSKVTQKEVVSLGMIVDNCEHLHIDDITTQASLARFIRIDKMTGQGLTGTGKLDISTIPHIDVSEVSMDGTTPITDQKAIQLSTVQGKLTGKIKNYGYPIASSSGNSGMDLSGFEFESCGAADGAGDQNACVNFKNTSGYVLEGLKFKSCTGRLLYATSMTGGSIVGFNANTLCTGGVTIEGSSNDFMYQSNVLLGTGTLRIFAGTNMGSTAYSNYKGTGITTSAYPAGWT